MTSPRANFLAGTPLNRLGHRRGDAGWLSDAGADALYLPVWKHRNLVRGPDPVEPALLPWRQLEGRVAHRGTVFLGRLGESLCFAVEIGGDRTPELPGEFQEIRSVGHRLAPEAAALLAYARAMIIWHDRHRYCGRCGSATRSVEAGHARHCEACDAKHFPRVDPAIIVLVADPDRCLLGRQPAWPPGRYSTIAGFVEPGESLEDAVAREVEEETGIAVDAVGYHSSQPWPFPSSLMLGFTAHPASTQIRLRDGELEDAVWITRDEIVAGRVIVPPPMSIAYRLIEEWFDSEDGRRLRAEVQPGPWIARPEP
jgi:NAD+ diphosphatase